MTKTKRNLYIYTLVFSLLLGILGVDTVQSSAKEWTWKGVTYSGSWSGVAPKWVCTKCRKGWDYNPGQHNWCNHPKSVAHECSGGGIKWVDDDSSWENTDGNISGRTGHFEYAPENDPCGGGHASPHTYYTTEDDYYYDCSGSQVIHAAQPITVTYAFYTDSGQYIGNNINQTTYNINAFPTNPKEYIITEGTGNLSYTINGYTFLGWSNATGFTVNSTNAYVGTNIDIPASITAKYVRNHRTLSMNANRGYHNNILSQSLVSKEVWVNSKYGTVANLTDLTESTNKLLTPKRKGYSFVRYRDESGNAVNDNTVMQ